MPTKTAKKEITVEELERDLAEQEEKEGQAAISADDFSVESYLDKTSDTTVTVHTASGREGRVNVTYYQNGLTTDIIKQYRRINTKNLLAEAVARKNEADERTLTVQEAREESLKTLKENEENLSFFVSVVQAVVKTWSLKRNGETVGLDQQSLESLPYALLQALGNALVNPKADTKD